MAPRLPAPLHKPDREVACCRYVYQKPYVEFFCSPDNFRKLREKLDTAPTVTYMAVNAEGEQHMNVQPSDVNAVTWGVFPAKEIVQPTVVDPQSFNIWKVLPLLLLLHVAFGLTLCPRTSFLLLQSRTPMVTWKVLLPMPVVLGVMPSLPSDCASAHLHVHGVAAGPLKSQPHSIRMHRVHAFVPVCGLRNSAWPL